MKEQILKILEDAGEYGYFSTKELAQKLGVKTSKVYKIVMELEKEEKIGCRGYNVTKRKGTAEWEDKEFSTHHPSSLCWYFIKK